MTIKQIQGIVGVKQDGIMGPITKAAIANYQQQLGVKADGIWGPITQAAYDKRNAPTQNYTPAPTQNYTPAPTQNYTPAPTQNYTPAPTTTSTPTTPTSTTSSTTNLVTPTVDVYKYMQGFSEGAVAEVEGVFYIKRGGQIYTFKDNQLVSPPSTSSSSGGTTPTPTLDDFAYKYMQGLSEGAVGASGGVAYTKRGGQIYTVNGNQLVSPPTTPTSTTPITTPTNTTPEKPPAGTPVFSSATANLTLGSTGNDVVTLQKYLNATGALGANNKPLATDGVYGPETQAAVKQFQALNNLKVDGVAGTNTKSTIMTKATSDSTLNSTGTVPTGNEEVTVEGNIVTDKNGMKWELPDNETALAVKASMDGLGQYEKETKQTINPNLSLTPIEISKILDAAKAKVRPEFAQKITGLQEDLQRNIQQTVDEYGNKIATQGEAFGKNLESARENYADTGLAFSGGRTKGELGMQESENRNLASLSSIYGSALGDYARKQEEQLGSDAMSGYNLPSLSRYSANIGTGRYSTTGGVSTGWSPGTFKLGSLQSDEEAAALALRNKNLEEASRRKVGGISYADLLA